MKNTSLCYLERGGQYLMLHRVKKENDENKDKWIGIGGKFEPGESPEDCVCREVLEGNRAPADGLPLLRHRHVRQWRLDRVYAPVPRDRL